MGTENSAEAKKTGDALAAIQNKIGTEAFERLKADAQTLSVEQVIDLALA
jgi:hypothetical protein